MGMISDVKHELACLEATPKSLRHFGLLVGTVFLLLAGLALFKSWAPGWRWSFVSAGALLVVPGTFAPLLLRVVHRWWMTLSFCLGWVMSRVLLTVLFFGAIVPVSLLGRLMNLPFARMRRAPAQASYWIDHKPRAANHHEEMF